GKRDSNTVSRAFSADVGIRRRPGALPQAGGKSAPLALCKQNPRILRCVSSNWRLPSHQVRRLMIKGFSDTVRDAANESILHNLLPAVSILFLCGGPCCAANTGDRINSERIAIADSDCLFGADTL